MKEETIEQIEQEYNNCEHFKEDDWGECTHKFHPDHGCKDNCLFYPTAGLQKRIKKFCIIDTIKEGEQDGKT